MPEVHWLLLKKLIVVYSTIPLLAWLRILIAIFTLNSRVLQIATKVAFTGGCGFVISSKQFSSFIFFKSRTLSKVSTGTFRENEI